MGEVKWTTEQSKAIYEKGNNILVAAAAGSGKTAVLVERIINKIINDKVDIDKILLVTFTNAAASEMRERILKAIYKKIDEEPENIELQRQITLLSRASICTIHSFCLDVIKNNFYEINISPNFRIGEETELEILKFDVLEDLFEKKYEEENKEFLNLVNTYTGYRSDDKLKEIILKIYTNIQSNPEPIKWLEENVTKFNFKENLNIDFAETEWGKILVEYIRKKIKLGIASLQNIKKKLEVEPEMSKFYLCICTDIQKLEVVLNLKTWDDLYNCLSGFSFDRWPVDKKATLSLKDDAKELREAVKEDIKKIKENLIICDSKEAIEDLNSMYVILESLKNIIIEFDQNFENEKRKRNLIDFGDIEHFALEILKNNDIANKYKEKFSEIAVDEYQDSNLIQEKILTLISNNNNIFMVGDVKQSIYKFRQARPDLFIEKYETYTEKNEETAPGIKIKLFKNFRSMDNILSITNLIFDSIMSKELGEMDYTEEEYLNICDEYKTISSEHKVKSELDIINLESSDDEEDDDEDDEPIENTTLEARYVCKKIQELMSSGYKVYDRDVGYRNLKFKDIAILLRSTSSQAPIYEKELIRNNFPVFTDSNNRFLDTIEISVIMSFLKIIDNPTQDIPLVTVLRSYIGKFDDNDLINIRMNNLNKSFYESMLDYLENDEADVRIKEKINKFFDLLNNYKKKNEYLPLHELIWDIYLNTGFLNYVTLMPNGLMREANLKILFEKAKKFEKASFKGLFNFINFIDKLKTSNGDFGSAKLIGENEDVIRIMSIHKSKGLEFPIVFLCGTGKNINFKDLTENILIHPDLGFGPKYINHERKIEYTTLAKEALKIKMKKETLSEEMRILYVALTRAKEKLIITGITKNAEKELKDKDNILYANKNEKLSKINANIIEKYKRYLDWIELVYLNNKKELEKILDFNIIDKKDIIEKETEQEDDIDYIKLIEEKSNVEVEKTIEKLLNWKYEYEELCNIQGKTSVTQIKQNSAKTGTRPELAESPESLSLKTPKFLSENLPISKAQIGTLTHLILSKLDVNINYTEQSIKDLIKTLIEKNVMTKEEAGKIKIDDIIKFTKSNIWNELKTAKKIYKEQPFYITIPVNELYPNLVKAKDEILVQGIIDLYYIDKDGKIVLVDYKTDFIKEGEEYKLIDRYKKQLEIYKEAIEKATGKKVRRVIIYSTNLSKEIEIKM